MKTRMFSLSPSPNDRMKSKRQDKLSRAFQNKEKLPVEPYNLSVEIQQDDETLSAVTFDENAFFRTVGNRLKSTKEEKSTVRVESKDNDKVASVPEMSPVLDKSSLPANNSVVVKKSPRKVTNKKDESGRRALSPKKSNSPLHSNIQGSTKKTHFTRVEMGSRKHRPRSFGDQSTYAKSLAHSGNHPMKLVNKTDLFQSTPTKGRTRSRPGQKSLLPEAPRGPFKSFTLQPSINDTLPVSASAPSVDKGSALKARRHHNNAQKTHRPSHKKAGEVASSTHLGSSDSDKRLSSDRERASVSNQATVHSNQSARKSVSNDNKRRKQHPAITKSQDSSLSKSRRSAESPMSLEHQQGRQRSPSLLPLVTAEELQSSDAPADSKKLTSLVDVEISDSPNTEDSGKRYSKPSSRSRSKPLPSVLDTGHHELKRSSRETSDSDKMQPPSGDVPPASFPTTSENKVSAPKHPRSGSRGRSELVPLPPGESSPEQSENVEPQSTGNEQKGSASKPSKPRSRGRSKPRPASPGSVTARREFYSEPSENSQSQSTNKKKRESPQKQRKSRSRSRSKSRHALPGNTPVGTYSSAEPSDLADSQSSINNREGSPHKQRRSQSSSRSKSRHSSPASAHVEIESSSEPSGLAESQPTTTEEKKLDKKPSNPLSRSRPTSQFPSPGNTRVRTESSSELSGLTELQVASTATSSLPRSDEAVLISTDAPSHAVKLEPPANDTPSVSSSITDKRKDSIRKLRPNCSNSQISIVSGPTPGGEADSAHRSLGMKRSHPQKKSKGVVPKSPKNRRKSMSKSQPSLVAAAAAAANRTIGSDQRSFGFRGSGPFTTKKKLLKTSLSTASKQGIQKKDTKANWRQSQGSDSARDANTLASDAALNKKVGWDYSRTETIPSHMVTSQEKPPRPQRGHEGILKSKMLTDVPQPPEQLMSLVSSDDLFSLGSHPFTPRVSKQYELEGKRSVTGFDIRDDVSDDNYGPGMDVRESDEVTLQVPSTSGLPEEAMEETSQQRFHFIFSALQSRAGNVFNCVDDEYAYSGDEMSSAVKTRSTAETDLSD